MSLQQPVDPQPWMLDTHGGDVALFRGSLNYAYPIAAPSILGGLQPNMALRYSSAAADSGFDQQYQPGENLSAGLGWSLDIPKVTRAANRDWVCFGDIDWQHICSGAYAYGGSYRNDFTLSLNGQTFFLQPKVYTDTHNGGEYVTEDYSPLRILRCTARYTSVHNALCNLTVNTESKEYWQVWTPDGTRYVFGVDASSENLVLMKSVDWIYHISTPYHRTTNAYSGYAGESTSGNIPRTWFLRYVYAAERDNATSNIWSVKYNYATSTNTILAPFGPNPSDRYSANDYVVRPSSILYGPSVREDGSAATQRFKIGFHYGWGPRLISITTNLADASGNTTTPLQQYRLGTDNGQALDSVEEKPWSQGAWQTALPKTNFVYTDTAHNNGTKKLLRKISNGYGGEWEYAYEGTPTWNSYWVVTSTIRDGVAGSTAMTRTYAYSSRDDAGWCLSTSGSPCVDGQHLFSYPNNLVGWSQVTETARGTAGEALAVTTHQFYFRELNRLGREYETRTMDAALRTLRAQKTDYGVFDHYSGLPRRVHATVALTTTTWPGGDDADNIGNYQRVAYDYGYIPNTYNVLLRGRNSATGGHSFTFTLPSGFKVEHYWAFISVSNTQVITTYSCATTKGSVLSYDCAAEGKTSLGLAGYLTKTSVAGTNPVVRCHHSSNGDYLIIPYNDCAANGYIFDAIMGYAVYAPYLLDDFDQLPLQSQLMRTREYESGNLVKVQSTRYAMNADAFIVKPISQTLQDAYGNRLSEVRYNYDNAAYGSIGNKGRLTYVQDVTAGDGADKTRDVSLQYDARGTVTQTTLFNDYGTVGATNTNRAGQKHRYGYDAGWGTFMLTYTNPLTQSLRRIYYCINEANGACASDQPWGALKAVRDPNSDDSGSVQTIYRYDAYGRLTKVIRPLDSDAYPSTQYTYTTPYSITGFTGVRIEVAHRETSGCADCVITSFSFSDGLGRAQQTRAEFSASEQTVVNTRYDAQGRAWWTQVPVTETVSTTLVRPIDWLSRPAATTQFDALGREVKAVGADGSTCSAAYIINVKVSVDANGHLQREMSDVFGRTKRVVETLTTLEDFFDTLNTATWINTSSYHSIVSGALQSTASATPWGTYIYRPASNISATMTATLNIPTAVKFEFKVSDTNNGTVHYMLETAGGTYRRVAILAMNNKLHLQTTIDGTNYEFKDILSPAQADVWYVGVIRVATLADGVTGWANAEVWQRDNPAVKGTATYMNSAMGRASFRFAHTLLTGTATLDNYQELNLWGTNYTYDVLDKLRTVTDALGNTTVITYDAQGRKTAMRDPDMGIWTYGYDLAGNLITQTDALAQTLWFGYDALNRLKEKRVGSSAGLLLAQYGYDLGTNGIGHRTSMSNTYSNSTYYYDSRGRLVNEPYGVNASGAPNFGTSYTYDALDRVVRMTYPTGEVVTTTYNTAGQPLSLRGAITFVSSAAYNALGSPTRISFGNGLETRYQYFGLDVQQGTPGLPSFYGRLRRICVLAQTSATDCENEFSQPVTDPVMNLALHYDSVGNISTYRDTARQQKILLTYDSLDRLITATVDIVNKPVWWDSVISPFTETYSYTPIGNFISKAGVTQYYSGTKPHAVTSLSNGATFQYDANGNMTQRVELSGTQWVTYTQGWDVDNKLIAVTNTVSGQVTRYRYDADGERVIRDNPDGTQVVYVHDYLEQNWDGIGVVTSYFSFGGQRVAMWQGNKAYWLHGDHLGSASLTTNITGAVVSEMRYYPFGETRWMSGTIPTDRLYTGQRAEANIGLYDYNARMYSPSLGRFISADSIVPEPSNPQALNRYAYVFNNPIKYQDPDGNDPLDSAWFSEFVQRTGRQPDWYDFAIRLFLIAYPSEKTWGDFYNASNQLRDVGYLVDVFKKAPPNRSWDNLPGALNRLSAEYTSGEKGLFIHDIGFLFAGLQSRFDMPAWQAAASPQHTQHVYLREGGLDKSYTGSDGDANVHHWAWAVLLGYCYGYQLATTANDIREWQQGLSQPYGTDQTDRKIGDAGARIGNDFANASITVNQASTLLLQHLPVIPRRLTK